MFWNRFYSLCIDNKTTPAAVVKVIGVSHGATTKWKNGTKPNADVVVKIADYFDVSTDYLLGITDKKNKATPLEQPINPKQKILLDISANMSDEDLKKLIEYADLLNLRHNQ